MQHFQCQGIRVKKKKKYLLVSRSYFVTSITSCLVGFVGEK